MLHNEHNQTLRTYAREASHVSLASTRAIFITSRCNNRAVTATLGRLPALSPSWSNVSSPLAMSLDAYSFFLIVSSGLQDTRTHVVVELYDTERSYVEALQILVNVSTFIKFHRPEQRSILYKVELFFERRKKINILKRCSPL